MTNSKELQALDLLPCPFCGNDAQMTARGGGDLSSSTLYCILCNTDNCLCNSFDSAFYTMIEAITKWNTRAAMPIREMTVEEVADILVNHCGDYADVIRNYRKLSQAAIAAALEGM